MPASAVRCRAYGSRRRGVPSRGEPPPPSRLEVSAEDDSGRRLLSESWPLDRTADAYLKFMKTFEPLRGWIDRREQVWGTDAFVARGLLIHHFRPGGGRG